MEGRRKNASEMMANHIMSGLQESGERDYIKDWLMDDLESTGWKAYMFQKASEITKEKEGGGKVEEEVAEKKEEKLSGEKEGEQNKAKAPMKTFELAERLSKLGHDAVPSSVRVRLLNQLLQATRRAVESSHCQPTKPES